MALVDLIATGKEAEQLIAQRDSLLTQVADLQNQILTANLQATNDKTTIDDLTAKLKQALPDLVTANQKIADFQSEVNVLTLNLDAANKQLAATLPSLQFVEGYESDPIVTDVLNKAFSTWSPRVGPNIGGEAPAKYSAQPVNGKLALNVTGTPPTKNLDGTFTKHWCDVLWVDKRPALPDYVTDFALDFGVVPIALGDPASDQCLEFDTLCIDNNSEFNLSSQYVRSSGKIQIANGATKGGWIDSGITLTAWDLAAHHTMRWVYKLDRPGKSCQYVALIVDGVRHDVDPAVGVQPAYPQAWGNQLALQLQQDVSSVGGSYTSVFDSIKYVYLAK